jgi:hypothetical protein
MDVAKGGSWHFGFFMASEYPEMLTTGRERHFLKKFAYRDSANIKDAISEQDIDEYLKHYASPGGMTAGFGYYRSLLVDAKENQRWVGSKAYGTSLGRRWRVRLRWQSPNDGSSR